MKALLFGAIGSLVETSELQREAFNRAFQEAGLTWHWSRSEYRELLQRSGGKERIARIAKDEGADVDAEAVHARKTEIFHELLAKSMISARPGVAATIAAAKRAGIKLGFATDTSRGNVEAILKAARDDIPEGVFDFVGDTSKVKNRKPEPDIYHVALDALGVSAEDAVAIEDSDTSAQAAKAAGVRVIAFPGALHEDRKFKDVWFRTTQLEPSALGLGDGFDDANTRDSRVA